MKFKQKKPIYFLTRSIDSGSFNLRGIQISEYINKKYKLKTTPVMKDAKFLNKNTKEYQNSVLYFIKIHLSSKDPSRDTLLALKQQGNTLIFDMSELKANYQILLNDPNIIANLDLFDVIVVMNKWMKEHLLRHLDRSDDSIEVIYHHWDIRITDLLEEDHYMTTSKEEIKYIYNGVEGDPSDPMKANCLLVGKIDEIEKITKFEELKNKDVCFFNLRSNKSPFYHFKSNIKLSNAAALESVIITTKDKSLYDLIPNDYPYFIEEDDLNEEKLREMMEKVNEDRKNNNKEFQIAKDIMSKVKVNTNIDNIALQYLTLFKRLDGVKKKVKKVKKK